MLSPLLHAAVSCVHFYQGREHEGLAMMKKEDAKSLVIRRHCV